MDVTRQSYDRSVILSRTDEAHGLCAPSRMPKPTFFNLPQGKRDRIVELAIDEFAERPYHEASLSRIVARAGIAKGSIYQYFEHKLDLYRWLVTEEVPRRKRAFIERDGASMSAASDLRSFLRGPVLSGIRFLLSDPRVARLAEGLLAPTRDPELRALGREVREAGLGSFRQLLETHPVGAQIRSDVDLDLVVRLLAIVLGYGMRALVDGHLGLDLDRLLDDPQAARIDPGRLETFVDATVTLVVEGIEKR